MGRWFERLSEFDYTIEYQRGEENKIADALSRNSTEKDEETSLVGLPVLGVKLG